MAFSDPITVEDATSVGFLPGGSLVCADPILAGSTNCAEWSEFPNWDPTLGHRDNRISAAVIANLYRAGYALVKVLPGPDLDRMERIRFDDDGVLTCEHTGCYFTDTPEGLAVHVAEAHPEGIVREAGQ